MEGPSETRTDALSPSQFPGVSSIELFYCCRCLAFFFSRLELLAHAHEDACTVPLSHSIFNYICCLCGARFATVSAFTDHMCDNPPEGCMMSK